MKVFTGGSMPAVDPSFDAVPGWALSQALRGLEAPGLWLEPELAER